jgi:transcriptional regulator with GAF, ATPase, and Fis domain
MNMTDIQMADPRRQQWVGESQASLSLVKTIAKVAPFGSTVLITGPSGTGKELVARQIHLSSPRSRQHFVPVDCASMTGELMASQLFGHVKGAFTSADHGSLGCFRAADQGTIFLDEIGELPLPLQSKLLRVIQERAVVPVGCHEAIPVDVRIVAATNRDLRQEVAKGNFREDLFYRLSVVTIQTTPLCERTDDIPALSKHFLDELEAQGHPRHELTTGARELLELYDWPGNVRELKNILEQAALVAEEYWITSEVLLSTLSPAIQGRRLLGTPDIVPVLNVPVLNDSWQDAVPVSLPRESRISDAQWPTLDAEERRLIVKTLEHTYFNKSAAARLLDISRQALLRKMTRLGISDTAPLR